MLATTPHNDQVLMAARQWAMPDVLSVEILAALAAERGIDFATAVAYQQVRQSAQHREFIEGIDAQDDSHDPSAGKRGFRIAIVPGAFYREYPAAGGDGRALIKQLGRLGYETEVLPLPSFRRLTDGAEMIGDWLRTRSHQPLVLVSLSKGGGETKLALARDAAAFGNVLAWVNLSGILEGTALVNWLYTQRLRYLAVRGIFWWQGYPIAGLEDLRRGDATLLSGQLKLPEHLTAIHVVGFPLREHLTLDWGRRGHKRLESLGPNDGGGVLLGDAIARLGLIYPVWGADHYLRPAWDIRRLIVRLVRYVEEELLCRSA